MADRRITWVLTLLVAVWALLLPAQAQSRLALVVGNSAYANLPVLANPANDAKLIAAGLQSVGFAVVTATDQSQAQLKAAIATFSESVRAAGPDAIAMFYYAGHGVQIDGTNYLVPVDAKVNSPSDIFLGSVSAAELLKTLEYAAAKVNVLVLDACRDNPFKGGTRGFTRGLAKVEAPPGSIVAYATAPGQVAQDGTNGNSPYAQSLAKHLATPGLALEAVFKNVRMDVNAQTNGAQVPWEETSLTSDVVLNAATAAPPPPGPVQPTAAPTPETSVADAYLEAVGDNTIESYMGFLKKHGATPEAAHARTALDMLNDEKHWREALAQSSLGAFRIYRNLHPQGVYAAEADLRIAALSKPQVVTPPVRTVEVEPARAVMLIERRHDVLGKDIETIKGVSLEGCRRNCANTPACIAAAYRSDLQRCYLKSTAALIIRNRKVDIVLKADHAETVRRSAFEMLPQVDIPGGDLFPNSTKTATAQACLRLCEDTPGCNAFSFVTSNKSCWLKSNASGTSDAPAIVSGYRQD